MYFHHIIYASDILYINKHMDFGMIEEVPIQLRLRGGASCESQSAISLKNSSSDSNMEVSIDLRPRGGTYRSEVLRLQCKSLPRLTNHCDCSEKNFITPLLTASSSQILERSTCPFRNYQLKTEKEPVKRARLWGGGKKEDQKKKAKEQECRKQQRASQNETFAKRAGRFFCF